MLRECQAPTHLPPPTRQVRSPNCWDNPLVSKASEQLTWKDTHTASWERCVVTLSHDTAEQHSTRAEQAVDHGDLRSPHPRPHYPYYPIHKPPQSPQTWGRHAQCLTQRQQQWLSVTAVVLENDSRERSRGGGKAFKRGAEYFWAERKVLLSVFVPYNADMYENPTQNSRFLTVAYYLQHASHTVHYTKIMYFLLLYNYFCNIYVFYQTSRSLRATACISTATQYHRGIIWYIITCILRITCIIYTHVPKSYHTYDMCFRNTGILYIYIKQGIYEWQHTLCVCVLIF